MKIFFTLLFIISSQIIFAQNTGTIKGKIKDDSNSEAVIGASIFLKGTTFGASSDVEGEFQITGIPEGLYKLVISSVGYDTKEIDSVIVQAGKLLLLNTSLNPESSQIGAIEVIARKETGTTMAVIAEIREAEQVAVGISSEQITKSQDRDAAQVLRRIPGVSLQESRFAIIRGLPQRYNAVLINDIYAPSSEVDSRAFSFDLVPANMIDRVLIFKSGGPELPGDFAGGAVKIYTKNAPEENFANIALSYGGRIGTTLNTVSDYQASKTDFLGFDNGLRKLPNSFPSFLDNNLPASQRADIARDVFTPDLGFSQEKVLPDFRTNLNVGRRFNTNKFRFGTLTSINYANTHQFYNAKQNTLQNDQVTFPALVVGRFDDQVYTNSIRLGVLHNWSMSWGNNRIEFKNLFNQQSFRQSVIREGEDIVNNVGFKNYSQRFEQKSFYGGQLTGKHTKGENDRRVFTWATGFNYTNKQEPDWRRFNTFRSLIVSTPDGSLSPYELSVPGSANLTDGRYFSNLKEYTFSGTAAVEQKIGSSENPIKIRYGTYLENKDRNFQARYFSYLQSPGANISGLKGLPLSEVFQPSNINANAFTVGEGTSPIDNYKGKNTLLAGYIGAYIPVGKKISISQGVRIEHNIQQLFSRSLSGLPENANNPITSILPSLNVVYNLNDKQLVRFAYSRTVNRPEFRELAPFNFYDFNLNADTRGNSRLKVATIDNVDLRWEYYPSANELISFGAFYKNFQNPIENYLQNASSGGSALAFGYGNANNAQGYGVEMEIRKSFIGSSSKFFQNLGVVANGSYIISVVNVGGQVDLGPSSSGITTVDAPSNRTLVGQSPYLINAGLYYSSEKHGFTANLLYNVAGERLYLVGNNNQPSIYEVPRNIIDFNISKTFLDDKWEARIGVQDLLNQPFRYLQDSNLNGKIDGQDSDLRRYRPGTTLNATFTYKF